MSSHPAAADSGTRTKVGPCTHDAIDSAGRSRASARLSVARLLSSQVGTSGAAIAHNRDDATSLVRQAAAARSLRASTPVGPGRHRAVDRARVSVASLADGVIVAARAVKTAVSLGLKHAASLSGRARAARRAAGGPSVPAGHDAVDGARMSVARLLSSQSRASDAAIAH